MLRWFRRLLIRMLVCAFAAFACWFGGFAWFLLQVPPHASNDATVTDAIVVLTGGKGRIDYGIKLLSEGKGIRLFISGVDGPLTPGGLLARYRPALSGTVRDASNQSVIMLGRDARNTIGNAKETKEWMQREKLKSLRLVTANYHMPRALREFRFAMPGARIVPDAVLPEDFDLSRWWMLDASSRLLLSEYHKYMMATLRHWLIEMAEEEAG